LLVLLFVLLLDSRTLTRVAMWSALVLAFSAFWFALSAAVAARTGSTAKHAVTLASCWLVLTVLLPGAVNLVVKTLQPVPSRIDLIVALRAAADTANEERSKLLNTFYEDHPELAPGGAEANADEFATLQLVTSQAIEREIAPVLARYEEQLERQQSLVEKLQFLSPALMTYSALADVAGTGLARHRWFLAQARAHHAELRAFFEPRALRGENFAAWDEVPTFRYVEESTQDVFARVAAALAALLFLSLALGANAAYALNDHRTKRTEARSSWMSLLGVGLTGCSLLTTSFDAYDGPKRSIDDIALLIGYPDWIREVAPDGGDGRTVYERRRDGGYLRVPATIRLVPGSYTVGLSYVSFSDFALQAYGDGIVVRGPVVFSVELVAGHTYSARRQECNDATPCHPISAVYFWIMDETSETVVAGIAPSNSGVSGGVAYTGT
jgi:ABC-2 type transport system permease protein